MQKTLLTLFATVLLSSSLLFAKTLVTVNGHPIGDTIIPKGYENLDDEKKANLMEHLIKEELIHAYLLKDKIVQTQEFKEAYDQQKKIAQEQYKKVTDKDLNEEQLRNIKGSIALALYQRKQFDATNVTDNDTKNFYNENQEKFNFPNSIEIANIITQTEDEAKQVIKKLKAAKDMEQAFVESAKEHKQNGYMGWFGEGMAPQNLFDAAYKANPKTLLSSPIQTKHGFHIVYLLNKKAAGKLSYDESKENIARMLKQQKVVEALENKVNDMYGQAKIVY